MSTGTEKLSDETGSGRAKQKLQENISNGDGDRESRRYEREGGVGVAVVVCPAVRSSSV